MRIRWRKHPANKRAVYFTCWGQRIRIDVGPMYDARYWYASVQHGNETIFHETMFKSPAPAKRKAREALEAYLEASISVMQAILGVR